MAHKVQPGDVYAKKLPNGLYGAVRVIRVRRRWKVCLLYTSQYLGHSIPGIDEPLLRRMLQQHRFCYHGEAAITWLSGSPPAPFIYVGNIPPTAGEARMQSGNADLSGWCDTTGDEAFLEWRWVNDRAAFEAEVRKAREQAEQHRRVPQEPTRMISTETFWRIMGLLDWRHEGDDEKVLEPAVKALAEMSATDLCAFEERLAYFLYQLDTREHAKSIGRYSYEEKEDYVSSDGFLYARCAAVANGKEFYEAALRDPTKMPKDIDFEALLSLAPKAHELATGEEFDYVTGCSYESFSNVAGWSRGARKGKADV